MRQQELFKFGPDLSNKRVLCSLSGGINSAGLLCYLGSEYPQELRPKWIFLFYVHLDEHSPDTMGFVEDCVKWARGKFERVIYQVYLAGSVLDFFEKQNMIPHPMFSPCSEQLKIIPIHHFMDRCQIEFDLIGYVRTEKNRISRQLKKDKSKIHLIGHLTDDDCFEITKKEIGWYPAIYDIKDEKGKRIFAHNNCLPCKNMIGMMNGDKATGQYKDVQLYYPEYFDKAAKTTNKIGSYFGRKKDFDGHCKFCEM